MFLKSFDGTSIYYRISRHSGPFLIFIHGWANNWTTWKKEILYLQRKGYSTLALDLRGHGRSGKPDSKNSYSLESFAKDIKKIVDKEKLKSFVLIGHSMGGAIALTYYKMFASRAKQPKALILTDTTCANVLNNKPIVVLSPFIQRVLEFLIRHEHIRNKNFSHLKDIDLTTYQNSSDYKVFYEGLHQTPMKCVFACLKAMVKYDVTEMLRSIGIPVLIIEGEKDTLLPKADSVRMKEQIKNAQLSLIPEGRHFVNLTSPKLVAQHIEDFLKAHKLQT